MAPQGSGWKVLFYPSTSRTSHFEWLEYVGITTDSPIFSKQIPKLHDFSFFFNRFHSRKFLSRTPLTRVTPPCPAWQSITSRSQGASKEPQ
jgi:hypothetical protein